jgi:hypothetical protein
MTAAAHDPNLQSIEDVPASLSGRQLALLRHLEISLKSSHQAVLSRDIARLEWLTDEQRSLLYQFSFLYGRDQNQPGVASAITEDLSLSARIRQAQAQVLYLGRVQSALLNRAQQRLRAVSNRCAGTQTTYALIPGSRHVELRQAKLGQILPAVKEG